MPNCCKIIIVVKNFQRRLAHLKKCAVSNNLSVEQIKNLSGQQLEEHKNLLETGLLLPGASKKLVKFLFFCLNVAALLIESMIYNSGVQTSKYYHYI